MHMMKHYIFLIRSHDLLNRSLTAAREQPHRIIRRQRAHKFAKSRSSRSFEVRVNRQPFLERRFPRCDDARSQWIDRSTSPTVPQRSQVVGPASGTDSLGFKQLSPRRREQSVRLGPCPCLRLIAERSAPVVERSWSSGLMRSAAAYFSPAAANNPSASTLPSSSPDRRARCPSC